MSYRDLIPTLTPFNDLRTVSGDRIISCRGKAGDNSKFLIILLTKDFISNMAYFCPKM
jgi:hypothetical protein